MCDQKFVGKHGDLPLRKNTKIDVPPAVCRPCVAQLLLLYRNGLRLWEEATIGTGRMRYKP
jgi:hypothetical protein